jgi:hypothetical protein
MTEQRRAYTVLTINTLAFTVCFAVWMMNGVLITFLVSNGVFDWDKAEMGWLIGIPVLTGAVMRLPVGVLTDKYGGRIVFGLLLLISAIPMYLVSYADTYMHFLLAGLGFGLSGASFAVGIAYTSVRLRFFGTTAEPPRETADDSRALGGCQGQQDNCHLPSHYCNPLHGIPYIRPVGESNANNVQNNVQPSHQAHKVQEPILYTVDLWYECE